MENETVKPFLSARIRELREKNGFTLEEMAQKLATFDNGVAPNKSSLSRVESGKTGEKKLVDMAEKYCRVLGMNDEQTKQFLRGERVAIPDTSALLHNTQLIDELNKEYSKVVIPKVVVDELDGIKNRYSDSRGRKAWEVLRGISYGERIVRMDYAGPSSEENSDCRIIWVARKASENFLCKVDIITEDTDYSAYLKGDESVSALHLREYMATKQDIVNMNKLSKIESYYGESYDECEIPSDEEVNAYLPDGNTLLIAVVRDKKQPFQIKKKKIQWLISHGANIDKRDNSRRYIPAVSHAIQMGDYQMFEFLLHDCNANPNIGSRNPFDSGKVRQKNEGNMPLMIAAWDGRDQFVDALCKDERTSINQQDANGFTALMKACMNGNNRCRDILEKAGADQKIVDIDGRNAQDHYNRFFEYGPMRKTYNRSENSKNGDNRKPYSNNYSRRKDNRW